MRVVRVPMKAIPSTISANRMRPIFWSFLFCNSSCARQSPIQNKQEVRTQHKTIECPSSIGLMVTRNQPLVICMNHFLGPNRSTSHRCRHFPSTHRGIVLTLSHGPAHTPTTKTTKTIISIVSHVLVTLNKEDVGDQFIRGAFAQAFSELFSFHFDDFPIKCGPRSVFLYRGLLFALLIRCL